MYNETYEDYIRSILGYPENNNMYFERNIGSMQNDELEECYPEIYKRIYPHISRICQNRTAGGVTANTIEEMADEVLANIDINQEFNLNINLNNQVKTEHSNENRNTKAETTKTVSKREDRRPPRNNGLRDLIKILLIRELIGRPGNHMPRPPFPGGRPPRPPFPGNGPGPRPPFPGGGPNPRPPMPRERI